jgi:hypothetical protein
LFSKGKTVGDQFVELIPLFKGKIHVLVIFYSAGLGDAPHKVELPDSECEKCYTDGQQEVRVGCQAEWW